MSKPILEQTIGSFYERNKKLKMKKNFLHTLCLLVLVLLTSCTSFQKENRLTPWAHIELGAGNYGNDGHTKISQQMTVLMELTYVSKAHNYIDELPSKDKLPYKPEQQFAVLFQTLDQLVTKRGPNGIFHINDLYIEYAEVAANYLKNYANTKGYHKIQIKTIGGDYSQINPLITLKSYNKSLYDSAHLKNPEISFYHYGMDGDKMLANKLSRDKARKKLQYLANLSKEGLYFFPIGHINFIPIEEKEEFIDKNKFYLPTTEWKPVPYYFPEGQIIDQNYGKVYLIKNNSI